MLDRLFGIITVTIPLGYMIMVDHSLSRQSIKTPQYSLFPAPPNKVQQAVRWLPIPISSILTLRQDIIGLPPVVPRPAPLPQHIPYLSIEAFRIEFIRSCAPQFCRGAKRPSPRHLLLPPPSRNPALIPVA